MWRACVCLGASFTSVSQVHDSNVCTDYQSHLLCAQQVLAKQLPETRSRVVHLQSNIIRWADTHNNEIACSVSSFTNVEYNQTGAPHHANQYNHQDIFNTMYMKSRFRKPYLTRRKCQRTSFVPLEYHYRTTISKTSRKQRAFTYLWSTTIVPLFFILNLTPPLTKLRPPI